MSRRDKSRLTTYRPAVYSAFTYYRDNTIIKGGRLLDQYVDVMQAALRLNINVDTVKRLIRQGKLPATRWGNKYIIDKDVLEMFAATYNPLPGRKKRLL